MSRHHRLWALPFALSLLLGLVAIATAQSAAADTEICAQYGSTTIAGGRYVVANNRWGTSETQASR